MKRADKFIIPNNWKVLFNDLGINLPASLRYAKLPPGLFDQERIQLSPSQYFQLWQGIEDASLAQGIDLPLTLSKVMSIESFDAPIFAAICSPNLNSALKRLQEYKPLIGPMILALDQSDIATHAEISCYGYEGELPRSVNLTELVFFTQLARLALRKQIKPIKVELPELPENLNAYVDYFGCNITKGESTSITFSAEDAQTPFLTNNHTLLRVFDGDIRNKLEQLNQSDATTDKVYDNLMNLLPQGISSIEIVASNMAMSKRTLQRKLSAEQSNYQTVLNLVRQDLATHYLTKTDLPITEVSFLLGFQETNSFNKAYRSWTGMSPTLTRNG
jgi:AraC-like DNA-binding protein